MLPIPRSLRSAISRRLAVPYCISQHHCHCIFCVAIRCHPTSFGNHSHSHDCQNHHYCPELIEAVNLEKATTSTAVLPNCNTNCEEESWFSLGPYEEFSLWTSGSYSDPRMQDTLWTELLSFSWFTLEAWEHSFPEVPCSCPDYPQGKRKRKICISTVCFSPSNLNSSLSSLACTVSFFPYRQEEDSFQSSPFLLSL